MKRPLAYITAAWSGDPCEATEQAVKYCRAVYEAGFSPICPTLCQPLFLNDAVPEEHKSGIDMGRNRVVAKSAPLRFRLAAKTACAPLLLLFPQNLRFCRNPEARSHVLVVCGHTVTEAMKNDIAVAQRLGITATTLEGILTVKGQGRR